MDVKIVGYIMDVKIAGIYGCLFPQAYGNFIGNLSHV